MTDRLLRDAAHLRLVSIGSTRDLTPDRDLIGMAGEHAFARDFHLHHDLRSKPAGDGGIDFWLPLMLSIDVKTSPRPGYLLVKAGKVVADIYVLAHATPDNLLAGECLGFAFKDEVLAAPLQDFNNAGIINHCLPRKALRPMDELRQRLALIGFVS